MTYEPLHHKYRPQTFSHLVGQDAIATTLTHAIEQQRIAPAYLFTGPRGTGKTSSARILAKSLNCLSRDRPTATPCGTCDACQEIATGIALDVIEIDAASNTGVDNIRELIEKAQFAPVRCRYKVYVIDECHMLSTAAFNALLKTLEEPPDRIVFVLATTDPQRVLPTIISRCQRFDFRRIPLEAMITHLRKIAALETIDVTESAITLVAQIAQGGLRDAESLLDQLSLLPPPVKPEAVWDLVGAVPERDLFDLLQAIVSDHPETLIEHTRRLMNRGREPLIVLQNLASFYRDLLIAKTAPQRNDLVAITATTWQDLCTFAQHLDIATILHGQQHLRTSEIQIKNTTQPRLWLEVTLLGLLPSALSESVHFPNPNAASFATPSKPIKTTSAASNFPQGAKSKELQISQTPTRLEAPDLEAPDLEASGHIAPGYIAPATNSKADVILTQSTPPPTSPAPLPQTPTEIIHPQQPNLQQIWESVLTKVELHGTKTLLQQQVQLLNFNHQTATIGTILNWQKMVQSKLSSIEDAFSRAIGQPIKVKIEILSKASNPSFSESQQQPDPGNIPTQIVQPNPSASAPISSITDIDSTSPHFANTNTNLNPNLNSINSTIPVKNFNPVGAVDTNIKPDNQNINPPEAGNDSVSRNVSSKGDIFNANIDRINQQPPSSIEFSAKLSDDFSAPETRPDTVDIDPASSSFSPSETHPSSQDISSSSHPNDPRSAPPSFQPKPSSSPVSRSATWEEDQAIRAVQIFADHFQGEIVAEKDEQEIAIAPIENAPIEYILEEDDFPF